MSAYFVLRGLVVLRVHKNTLGFRVSYLFLIIIGWTIEVSSKELEEEQWYGKKEDKGELGVRWSSWWIICEMEEEIKWIALEWGET